MPWRTRHSERKMRVTLLSISIPVFSTLAPGAKSSSCFRQFRPLYSIWETNWYQEKGSQVPAKGLCRHQRVSVKPLLLQGCIGHLCYIIFPCVWCLNYFLVVNAWITSKAEERSLFSFKRTWKWKKPFSYSNSIVTEHSAMTQRIWAFLCLGTHFYSPLTFPTQQKQGITETQEELLLQRQEK